MLLCQLRAMEPVSVLSSQGRTFPWFFNAAKVSSFEKAKQAHLRKRLSMIKHLTVLQIAGLCLPLTRGLMRLFVSLPWCPELNLMS